jgi:hypothetical protein
LTGDRFQGKLAEVYGIGPDESLIVIVPSERVSGEEFMENLRLNGIQPKALAAGTGRVVDHEGLRYRVSGTIIGSISKKDLLQTEKVAKLCGITVVLFD